MKINILSPEGERGKSQIKTIESMRICMNLDEYYDIIFKLNDYNTIPLYPQNEVTNV